LLPLIAGLSGHSAFEADPVDRLAPAYQNTAIISGGNRPCSSTSHRSSTDSPGRRDGQARYRRDAGHFVRWARRQKLTSLEFPATRWHGPARTIDTEARWAQPRWLLHDHAVNPSTG
jgi:hypothetical protein